MWPADPGWRLGLWSERYTMKSGVLQPQKEENAFFSRLCNTLNWPPGHQEPGLVRGKLPWTGMASGGSQSGLATGGSWVDARMEAVSSSPAWTILRISTQAGVCWRFRPFKSGAGPVESCNRGLHRDLTNVISEYYSNECVNIFITWSLLSAWLWHQDSWRMLFRGISLKH